MRDIIYTYNNHLLISIQSICKRKDEILLSKYNFQPLYTHPPKKNCAGQILNNIHPPLTLLYILQLMDYRYDSIRKHQKNKTRQSINFTLTSEEYEELIATPWVMITPTWGGRSRSLGKEFRSGYNRNKSLKWIQSEQNLSEFKNNQWRQWAKFKRRLMLRMKKGNRMSD